MQDLCFSHSNGFAFIPGGLDIEIAVPDVGIGIRLFSQQKDIIFHLCFTYPVFDKGLVTAETDDVPFDRPAGMNQSGTDIRSVCR